jgi:hypothetical protein
MPNEYTRQRINELLVESDEMVKRSLVIMYQRQTSDEQAGGFTQESNGVGFNGVDAGFGTSLARQVLERGTLSDKQLQAGRKMLRRYVGQLVDAANSGEKAEVSA